MTAKWRFSLYIPNNTNYLKSQQLRRNEGSKYHEANAPTIRNHITHAPTHKIPAQKLEYSPTQPHRPVLTPYRPHSLSIRASIRPITPMIIAKSSKPLHSFLTIPGIITQPRRSKPPTMRTIRIRSLIQRTLDRLPHTLIHRLRPLPLLNTQTIPAIIRLKRIQILELPTEPRDLESPVSTLVIGQPGPFGRRAVTPSVFSCREVEEVLPFVVDFHLDHVACKRVSVVATVGLHTACVGGTSDYHA